MPLDVPVSDLDMAVQVEAVGQARVQRLDLAGAAPRGACWTLALRDPLKVVDGDCGAAAGLGRRQPGGQRAGPAPWR